MITIILALVIVAMLAYYTWINPQLRWDSWLIPIYTNGRWISILGVISIIINLVISYFFPWMWWLVVAEITTAVILLTIGILEVNMNRRNVFMWFFVGNLVLSGAIITSIQAFQWIYANS